MKNLIITTMKGLLIFLLTIMSANVFSQTKYSGSFCSGYNEYYPLKYTREYKEDGNVFITLYKIYDPSYGYYLNITATHYKSEKKITVDVDDVTVKGGWHYSTQVANYEKPSLKMFGRPGSFKSLYDAQNVLPHKLALRFISNKFENVKVISIAKGDDSVAGFAVYILDK